MILNCHLSLNHLGAMPLNPQPLPPGFAKYDHNVARRNAQPDPQIIHLPQPIPPPEDKYVVRRNAEQVWPKIPLPHLPSDYDVAHRNAELLNPQSLPPGIVDVDHNVARRNADPV